MEHTDIEILCSGSNLEEISRVLQNFIQNNENGIFSFPFLMENNGRVILWTALFQLLQRPEYQSVHALCLANIRILSRDKTDLESLLCEKWIKVLIEKAELYTPMELGQNSSPQLSNKETAIEAMKCLCNIAYNSEVARQYCAETDIALGLINRIRIYGNRIFEDNVMLFDIRLVFILTAFRHDIRDKILDLHGMDSLMNSMNNIVLDSSSSEAPNGPENFLQDQRLAITCDILKAQFNLVMSCGDEVAADESEEAMFLKLMPILAALLNSQASSDEKLFDLHNNIANLLTRVPRAFYKYLTPSLNEGDKAKYSYDGRNMDALQSLVNLLQHKLSLTQVNEVSQNTNQYENLSPILTVMNKSARGFRSQRKYLRQVVLPPLRDVSLPPEKGSALRNQLCRLLTTPITAVRDLVAEFLFILCKEKVGRMVKYTGFGNAAGHLAQNGLLSGVKSAQYSSSSDDSDTEEYRAAQPHIDPVVGCTRPPRANPFEGMSEEQKEYEAMKLVKLFDEMVSKGVVKPAFLGPDGRPQAIDHVLELRENLPNRPQS